MEADKFTDPTVISQWCGENMFPINKKRKGNPETTLIALKKSGYFEVDNCDANMRKEIFKLPSLKILRHDKRYDTVSKLLLIKTAPVFEFKGQTSSAYIIGLKEVLRRIKDMVKTTPDGDVQDAYKLMQRILPELPPNSFEGRYGKKLIEDGKELKSLLMISSLNMVESIKKLVEKSSPEELNLFKATTVLNLGSTETTVGANEIRELYRYHGLIPMSYPDFGVGIGPSGTCNCIPCSLLGRRLPHLVEPETNQITDYRYFPFNQTKTVTPLNKTITAFSILELTPQILFNLVVDTGDDNPFRLGKWTEVKEFFVQGKGHPILLHHLGDRLCHGSRAAAGAFLSLEGKDSSGLTDIRSAVQEGVEIIRKNQYNLVKIIIAHKDTEAAPENPEKILCCLLCFWEEGGNLEILKIKAPFLMLYENVSEMNLKLISDLKLRHQEVNEFPEIFQELTIDQQTVTCNQSSEIYAALTSQDKERRLIGFVLFNESPIGRSIILAAQALLFFPPGRLEMAPVRIMLAYLTPILLVSNRRIITRTNWENWTKCWQKVYMDVASDTSNITKSDATYFVSTVFSQIWEALNDLLPIGINSPTIDEDGWSNDVTVRILNFLKQDKEKEILLKINRQYKRGKATHEIRTEEQAREVKRIESAIMPEFNDAYKGWTELEYKLVFEGIKEHCQERTVTPPHGYNKIWGTKVREMLRSDQNQAINPATTSRQRHQATTGRVGVSTRGQKGGAVLRE